ncbi:MULTISPECIES: type III pantothenate kinase [Jonquetella]|uniref:Type III pantothenate kinase n=1 Tax=Jonquetella anthropi DSM 22815 TaxID=885272 RepID=H0UKH4_9BACT|nr:MULTISPECIES: type III pantothenate kinase [Jonquetella]EEX48374.1 pantothenate kinase, type III [Jonquetella anthropi E3_33 E1]EHM13183.1 pantothenate kinase, type III [Jonquetella anthropi DSM 22815]ERL23669.1 putative pantothenate kinase, type III [Jonquetella sp. BV3C21]
MLLAIDVGNTTTTLGVLDGRDVKAQWRLVTTRRTSDEIGLAIDGLLRLAGFEKSVLTSAILASVVPGLDARFQEAMKNYFGLDCPSVRYDMDLGVQVDLDIPSEVGADRLVNAVGAVELVGAPVIVADFGTAITLDVVLPGPRYVGGTIGPGLVTSVEALFGNTSKLPKINLTAPKKVVGRCTAECIRSGVIQGTAALIDGMVGRIEKELGLSFKVIATGGHAGTVASVSERIERVDPALTLIGLSCIASRIA